MANYHIGQHLLKRKAKNPQQHALVLPSRSLYLAVRRSLEGLETRAIAFQLNIWSEMKAPSLSIMSILWKVVDR